MTYILRPVASLRSSSAIVLIGCGGTGGYIAEGICRLFIDEPDVNLHLIDHDRIEEHNLRRQNFFPSELGEFKSKALAERLSRQFDRPIAYSIYPVLAPRVGYSESFLGMGTFNVPEIVIAAVDNARARHAIAASHRGMGWLIDAGNGDEWGQVLIGNGRVIDRPFSSRAAPPQKVGDGWAMSDNPGVVHALPLPTEQLPELLVTNEAPVPLDCAEAVISGDQSATINQLMAGLALDMVRKLMNGTLTWMGLYADFRNGTMRPMAATPENAARYWHCRPQDLVERNAKAKEA